MIGVRISTGTTFGVGARADEAFNSVVGFITPAPGIRKILDHVGRRSNSSDVCRCWTTISRTIRFWTTDRGRKTADRTIRNLVPRSGARRAP